MRRSHPIGDSGCATWTDGNNRGPSVRLRKSLCGSVQTSDRSTNSVHAATPGPGDALRQFLKELTRNTSVYQSLAASLGTVSQHGSPSRTAITAEGQRLLLHAQDAGILRRDAGFDDIVCVGSAIAIAVEQDSASANRIAHLVDLLLNGLHVR